MKKTKQRLALTWRLLPLLAALMMLVVTTLFAVPTPTSRVSYPLLFATAMAVSALLTPLVRKLTLRTEKFIKLPRSISIETHVLPTPTVGGVAIFLGVVSALCLTLPWSNLEKRILLASTVLVLFGLYDDSKPLSVPSKVVGQFLAAGILLLAPGIGGQLAVPQLFNSLVVNQIMATLWIVGLINAMNFLDIMDGLAAGTSAIAAFGFFLLAGFMSNGQTTAHLAIALAGGAMGFLIYNFEPASIFMGDTGSQFLGLVLATLTLHAASSSPSPAMLLPPIVLLGIPLFEITYTSTIRVWTGKAPWKGSKDHFPLRMFQMGFSVRRIVLTTYIVGFLLIPCAIWLVQVNLLGRLLILLVLALAGVGAGLWLSQVRVPKASSQRAMPKPVGARKLGRSSK